MVLSRPPWPPPYRVGIADARHATQNRPPSSIHLPRNPRPHCPIRSRPAAPCLLPPHRDSPKSATAPCLEALLGFSSCCTAIQRGRGRRKEWRIGEIARALEVATDPCRGRKSFDVGDHSRTGEAAERRGDRSRPLRSWTSRRRPSSATSTLLQAGPLHPPHRRLHIGQWPPR
jgi:hypothetical protein